MSTAESLSQPFPESSLPPAPAESLFRLTVEQYHDMARQGLLGDDERLELLEGLLVLKMTISPAHHLTTHHVQNALRRRIPDTHYVASPASLGLLTSEPEPDAAVVRGSADDYNARHPGTGDIALVVEVSDSSLCRDRVFKKPIYAKAMLPVYWIVNLVDRCVEVYSDPTGPAVRPDYRSHRDYFEAEEFPLVIDGLEIARIPVREVLA